MVLHIHLKTKNKDIGQLILPSEPLESVLCEVIFRDNLEATAGVNMAASILVE